MGRGRDMTADVGEIVFGGIDGFVVVKVIFEGTLGKDFMDDVVIVVGVWDVINDVEEGEHFFKNVGNELGKDCLTGIDWSVSLNFDEPPLPKRDEGNGNGVVVVDKFCVCGNDSSIEEREGVSIWNSSFLPSAVCGNSNEFGKAVEEIEKDPGDCCKKNGEYVKGEAFWGVKCGVGYEDKNKSCCKNWVDPVIWGEIKIFGVNKPLFGDSQ